MKITMKSTKKPAKKFAKSTRKAAVKFQLLVSRNFPWKSAARTKAQKAVRALQTHHRAQGTDVKCHIASCKKMSVENSDLCRLHRSTLILHVPGTLDHNVYGE